MDCDEKPLRAHSIQNARVLYLVQTDGHVLMPQYKLVKGEPAMGRNDASTFTGRCSKHDTELFKSIDTEPLDVDKCEHLRQLAYRSVMREMHTELANANRLWVIREEICKEQQVDPNEVATQASIRSLAFTKKAQEVYRYRRKHFDKPWKMAKRRTSSTSSSKWTTKARPGRILAFLNRLHRGRGYHRADPEYRAPECDENGRDYLIPGRAGGCREGLARQGL